MSDIDDGNYYPEGVNHQHFHEEWNVDNQAKQKSNGNPRFQTNGIPYDNPMISTPPPQQPNPDQHYQPPQPGYQYPYPYPPQPPYPQGGYYHQPQPAYPPPYSPPGYPPAGYPPSGYPPVYGYNDNYRHEYDRVHAINSLAHDRRLQEDMINFYRRVDDAYYRGFRGDPDQQSS